MSLLKFLVPFGVSFAESFLREYNSPSPAGGASRADSAFTIADSGRVGNMEWIAVPYAHVRAFAASNPDAGTIEAFNRLIQKWRHTEPAYVVHLGPFVDALLAAFDAHKTRCQLFVRCVEK